MPVFVVVEVEVEVGVAEEEVEGVAEVHGGHTPETSTFLYPS